jgi:hypothetical protein
MGQIKKKTSRYFLSKQEGTVYSKKPTHATVPLMEDVGLTFSWACEHVKASPHCMHWVWASFWHRKQRPILLHSQQLSHNVRTEIRGLQRYVVYLCWPNRWNSALKYESQCGGMEGCCGVSANDYSCAHHVTWSPNKLWRSNSYYLMTGIDGELFIVFHWD